MLQSTKDWLADRALFLQRFPRWFRYSFWLIVVGFFMLYLPIGMIIIHNINDDPNYKAGQFTVQGGSSAVAIMEALVNREVNEHQWTPNDPFFYPGAWLDRMPAFQRGVMRAISRFTLILQDQLGRVRGTSQADPDLQKAVSLLNYAPDVWIFDFSVSWLPTASSEKQYRAGLKSLQSYNKRLAAGQAVFDRRADNMIETLNSITTDLGASSAALDDHVRDFSGRLIDTEADDLFYETKGKLYAYYLILRELGKDDADIIRNKQLENVWNKAVNGILEGAELSHFFVFNASPNSQFVANHLTAQGFYLIQARTQLFEIINILQK